MASAFDKLFDRMKPQHAPQRLTAGSYLLMIAEVVPLRLKTGRDALAAEFLVLESDSNWNRAGERTSWSWILSTELGGPTHMGAAHAKEFAVAAWKSSGWAPTHISDHPDQLAAFLKGDNWRGVQVRSRVEDAASPRGSVTVVSWGHVKQLPGVTRALLDPAKDPDGAFTSAERLALEHGGEFWMGKAREYRALCGV